MMLNKNFIKTISIYMMEINILSKKFKKVLKNEL